MVRFGGDEPRSGKAQRRTASSVGAGELSGPRRTDLQFRRSISRLPASGFTRIIGGPEDPADSLANKELGHLSCTIFADTNCVTKMIVLEAWITYSFSGVSEPVTVPWITGEVAHKIFVTPPGTWTWDVSSYTCEHYHNTNSFTFDHGFFDGPLEILGTSFLCPDEAIELNVQTNGYDGFSSFQWSPDYDVLTPVIVDLPGIYALTVTDAFGCPFTDQINVTAIPPFTHPIVGPNFMCPEGDTAVLTMPGPYTDLIGANVVGGNSIFVFEPGI